MRATVTPIADSAAVIPVRGRSRRVWRVVKYVLGLGLAAAAVWAVTGKSDELSGSSQYLDNLHWQWVLTAAVAEAVSYLAFAGLQRRLLRAGGVGIPLPSMAGITLAGNAIQNSMPAGVVLSGAYAFRQFRRFGADDILAGWTLVAMTAVSIITLTVMAAIGLAMAASTGSALGLVGVILGILAALIVVLGLWVKRAWLLPRVATIFRLTQRWFHRPAGDPEQLVTSALERLRIVTPSRSQWTWALIMGVGNWVADLTCLVFAFWAVGSTVPWRGLLLAYAAAQLATNLPITPGGLGVVEGSLTVALVAFGGGQASTVAAVLLYRLFNFWLMLPIGWGAWSTLAVAARRRDHRERVAAYAPAVSEPALGSEP
ncbi:MAG: YbhN family protein [Actinomycetota bacterium]|nr:YbhN family protein [Actinomycetota bacterium]